MGTVNVTATDSAGNKTSIDLAYTVTVTPPPATTMLFGYSHTNRAKLEADTKVLVRADRAYEGGMVSNISQTVAPSLAARYTPIVSVKTANWASPDVASVRSLVKSCNRKIVLIFNHEPENDGNSPAQFKSMVNAYLDVCASENNSNVTPAINLMTSWIDKPAGQRSEDYIVTGRTDYVLSWDGYQRDASITPASKFGPALALNKKYNLRFAISETGSDVDYDGWIGKSSDWAAANGAVWYCYWPATDDANYYPPASAFPEFAAAALKYGGTPV